jgi:glycosyltransferase involved in cell wall biosynthesis
MLSIIVPFLNEEKNLTILVDEINDALHGKGIQYEIIFVDNGSTDGSRQEALDLADAHKHITTVRMRVKGKGIALAEGFKYAKGEYIMFMDGDLQDNPHNIIEFMNKIEEGYDLVNGIRKIRKDNGVVKVYSRFANVFLKSLMKSPFTDINCGFKIMRRQILEEIPLYANNFRFLPIAAYYKGFKVGEIPVDNRERLHGSTKYGIKKLFIGLIDTFNAYFLYQFSEKPLHFFGMLGGVFLGIGTLITVYLAIERLFFGVLLYRSISLLFGILFIIVGLQIMMTGLIGELIVYLHKKNNRHSS